MKNSLISLPSIQVAAAIIQKNHQFLITKRFEKSHLGHCWEFPGGKIERGETPEDCVVRECLEEIGVEVKPIRRLQQLWYEYPEVKVHLHFVLCELVSGVPRPLECSDIKWILANEFSKFEFPQADVEVIRELVKQSEF